MTRAAKRLYIYADLERSAAKSEKRTSNVGAMLLHARGMADAFAKKAEEELSETRYVEETTGEELPLATGKPNNEKKDTVKRLRR